MRIYFHALLSRIEIEASEASLIEEDATHLYFLLALLQKSHNCAPYRIVFAVIFLVIQSPLLIQTTKSLKP